MFLFKKREIFEGKNSKAFDCFLFFPFVSSGKQKQRLTRKMNKLRSRSWRGWLQSDKPPEPLSPQWAQQVSLTLGRHSPPERGRIVKSVHLLASHLEQEEAELEETAEEDLVEPSP